MAASFKLVGRPNGLRFSRSAGASAASGGAVGFSRWLGAKAIKDSLIPYVLQLTLRCQSKVARLDLHIELSNRIVVCNDCFKFSGNIPQTGPIAGVRDLSPRLASVCSRLNIYAYKVSLGHDSLGELSWWLWKRRQKP